MQPKSELHPKMPMFDELKNQVPVNSKNFFDPSLESSKVEVFRLCYGPSPYDLPRVVIGVPYTL